MRADFEMPFTAQMRLCANALSHSPAGLGLRVGHQLQLAAHGALGTAMQSATDLKAALGSFVRFISVRASFFSLAMFEAGQRGGIQIAVQGLPGPLIPFFSESILFTVSHCLAFYTGRREGASEIRLGYSKPSYAADYGSVFGEPIHFGCSTTQIAFDRELLSLPSPETDSVIYAQSVRRCRDRIDERQQNSDVTRNIRNFLLENPGKLWTVEEIAPSFSVSGRTLIRKLKENGTTYQALRDDFLKRQAATYLKSTGVEAVAISLGFADTSSFRRTFKRWFGMTPSEFSDR